MGDIADYYVQQMLERGPRLPRYVPHRPLVCRDCGAECYWAQCGGNWTLMEAGSKHKCDEGDRLVQAASGFESI